MYFNEDFEYTMTVYDYIVANGDIFKTNDPLFTADMKTAVNRMLKYNYRDKLMLYTETTEVQDLVDMILYDNKYKYINQFNLMQYALPALYTEKTIDIVSKNNTGTQTNAITDTTVNTGTQTILDTGTIKDTGTDRLETDGTNIVDPNDTQKSTLGFDGGSLIVNEKNANSQNKTTVDMTDLTTKDLTRTNNLSNQRTDNLTATKTVSDTRTDALTESVNDENNTINVSIRLSELEKMQENTAKLLYRVIAEDIISVIALRTW